MFRVTAQSVCRSETPPPACPLISAYPFEVFGKWPGMGDASYGFLVEVR